MQKPLVFLLSLGPLSWLVEHALMNHLGAHPVEHVIHFTGDWTLGFLLIVLAVTPLRWLTGASDLVRYRRMLGLFAFFYALLHFLAYAGLDQWFDWKAIVHDLEKHPYIWVGMAANILLWPLALTSSRRAMLRLGKNWKRLHRLVYVIPGLGVLHYAWLVKKDMTWPVVYGAVWGGLMVSRLLFRFTKSPLRQSRTTDGRFLRRSGIAQKPVPEEGGHTGSLAGIHIQKPPVDPAVPGFPPLRRWS